MTSAANRAGSPRRLSALLPVGISLLLVLSACGPAASEPASTQTAQALSTAAIQTYSAAAASSPSPTPSPFASSPALPPAPITPAFAAPLKGACDSSAFISDVTIPDGAPIAAGARFVKTWQVMNTGSCTWTTAYTIAFDSGDQMGGATTSLVNPVQPGQLVAIAVDLVAPTALGAYKGIWRMHNASGQPFGDFPYVQITVGAAPTACHTSLKNAVNISGHAGPEKVTIDYGLGQTFTDANGNYTFTVPYGWSGTVTPTKAKVHPWTFTPDHRSYVNVTCDLNHENYSATPPPGV